MCFEVSKSAKVKIADKDILCWKLLERGMLPFYKKATIPYQHGKISPYINLKVRDGKINRGYHSWKSNKGALIKENMWFRVRFRKEGVDYHICRFIIPKGTRYYSNRTDYVSESIILIG